MKICKANLLKTAYAIILMLSADLEIALARGKSGDLERKHRIPVTALEKKKEDRYGAALPGAGYSPDMGLILAALVGFYDNGKKSDDYFAYAPYKSATLLALSWSTKGMASVLIDHDAPYFKSSPYRLRSRLYYLRNLTEPYFGVGEASLKPLETPEGRIFSRYDDFYGNLLLNENGYTDAYYNYYLNRFLLWNLNVERDVFGGMCRIGAGVFASKVWIDDYSGKKVPGKSSPDSRDREDAIMTRTLLRRDYQAGEIVGFEGGWNNSLRVGFAYDTRDFESNPRNGMFHDFVFAWSDNLIGSGFDYSVSTLTVRFYTSPIPRWLDLILAARFGFSVKSGDIPFFTMNYIPSTDKHIYGLGGEYTMRGFRLSRFVAPVMAFGNAEARWVFTDIEIGGQLLEFMAIPFLDFGRVYDRVGNTTLDGMKYAYGIGLRLAWSQSFVVSFDFGFSEEERGSFYVTFGNIF